MALIVRFNTSWYIVMVFVEFWFWELKKWSFLNNSKKKFVLHFIQIVLDKPSKFMKNHDQRLTTMKNLVSTYVQFFCLAFFIFFFFLVNRSPSLAYWHGLMLGSYLIGFNVFETSWWGQHIDKLKASVYRSRICFSAALFFSLSSSQSNNY